MDNTRKMNIRIITTILGSLPDNTLVFSDKLPLTMSSKDGNKFEGNFDRMALECADNGNCTVWFDELGEKGIDNTYTINDFDDSEIEKVVKTAFDENIVDAVYQYLKFYDDNNNTAPSFALCYIKFKDEPDGDYFYIIKLSNDVVSDTEDDKVGYYCGNGFNELLSLFKEDNKQDFRVFGGQWLFDGSMGYLSETKRQECNREILKILEEVIKKYPDFRFGQILWFLGINGRDDKDRLRDIFYEEPDVTLRNICSTVKGNHLSYETVDYLVKYNKFVNGEEKIQ